MDPISIGIGVIGLGMSIFGGIGQSEAAEENARLSRDVAKQEQGINDQKQQAMELSARRQQMEITRTAQRARAQAVQNATTQGAQFGTGLQGGLAEITDQSLFNLVGVNSGLETGRNINSYNKLISQDKMGMAQAQSDSATAGGWASLGGALMKSGPMIGSLAKGFGGGSSSGGNNYGYTANSYGNGYT